MKPDPVNKMGADLAVQLMLVMVFGLVPVGNPIWLAVDRESDDAVVS